MFPSFDPSKVDPKVLMELSRLVQQLPPHQLNRMQSLMHNMMAGFDVSREMQEFEQSLPPEFRQKLFQLMAGNASAFSQAFSPGPAAGSASTASPASSAPVIETTTSTPQQQPMDLHQARMTVLYAVSEGSVSPEEAVKLLFPEG